MLPASPEFLPSVKHLLPRDSVSANRWDAFVMACADATFFHRAGWVNVVHDVFQHDTYFLYAEGDGQIQGVLPLVHIKSWLFGNSLVSLPFAVYGGVVSTNSRATTALENAAKNLAEKLQVAHLEYRNINPRHADWPTQDLYVTFRKNILADDDANMLAIPRKQRAMIRKGIQHRLASVIEKNVDQFFLLYASNVHRHGTPPMPKRYFTALQAEFGADCEVLTVIGPDGRSLSSVLSFYFRDEVLPYYAGDRESARKFSANDFKYWELMRRARVRGLKVFDFGRSKRGTGSYDFKKNWGFEPTPLHYEFCLFLRDDIPQNNPSNKKYKLLIDAWRILPVGVANWLGPFFVRNLG